MILKERVVPTKWFVSKQQLILDYQPWYKLKPRQSSFIQYYAKFIFFHIHEYQLRKIEIKENVLNE